MSDESLEVVAEGVAIADRLPDGWTFAADGDFASATREGYHPNGNSMAISTLQHKSGVWHTVTPGLSWVAERETRAEALDVLVEATYLWEAQRVLTYGDHFDHDERQAWFEVISDLQDALAGDGDEEWTEYRDYDREQLPLQDGAAGDLEAIR